MEAQVEFTIPTALKDFIFDLHESTRMSMRDDDVVAAYEVRFKELTEKYYAQSAFPDTKLVAKECNNDEEFLLFYREMTARHLFTKLKPSTNDLLESYKTYVQLFAFLLGPSEPQIMLSPQWANDVVQEFVYQFQGFCQFRSQVTSRNPEELRILDQNRSVWDLRVVTRILNDLVKEGLHHGKESSSILFQFGVFASVELARLECLTGDFTSSLSLAAESMWSDKSELIEKVPLSYISAYYHVGVSQLMLRRYIDAVDNFSVIATYINGLVKSGATGTRVPPQTLLQKTLDKILALTTIACALCPSARVSEQVRELIDSKWADKLRRISSGDVQCLSDLFEHACPKFITPAVPDYNATPFNYNQDTFSSQVAVFVEDARQQLSVLRIRSCVRLYASISLAKLARVSDTTEEEFFSQLLSYKHKMAQIQAHDSVSVTSSKGATMMPDVGFHIHDKSLIIETASPKTAKNFAAERFFALGAKKHLNIIDEITKNFARVGL